MGVYIKGMEMPKNCDSCRIMVFEDTNCVPELFCGCPIVFKAHPQGEDHRPDYCPLISVPNHGKLIDADTLKDKMLEYFGDSTRLCEEIRAFFCITPTIISAEEEET